MSKSKQMYMDMLQCDMTDYDYLDYQYQQQNKN